MCAKIAPGLNSTEISSTGGRQVTSRNQPVPPANLAQPAATPTPGNPGDALIQGGEGEGLFAATYQVSGDLNEPKIDVNEWSALAPGFIRDWFTDDGTELPDENSEDEPSPVPQPAKPGTAGGRND